MGPRSFGNGIVLCRGRSVRGGTSAGALNVVGLAGNAHLGLDRAAEHVVSLWESVVLDDVFSATSSVCGGGLRNGANKRRRMLARNINCEKF